MYEFLMSIFVIMLPTTTHSTPNIKIENPILTRTLSADILFKESVTLIYSPQTTVKTKTIDLHQIVSTVYSAAYLK